MKERELTDAESAVLNEAVEASSNFALAVERLQAAFGAVVSFNLTERSRLEEELAEVNARIAGLEK